ALSRRMMRHLTLTHILEHELRLAIKGCTEASATRRDMLKQVALAQRDRRHWHRRQLALGSLAWVEHVERAPTRLASAKPVGGVISAVGTHRALRIVGKQPISAAECKPAALLAGPAGVRHKAVFDDLQGQLRLDEFNWVVREVRGRVGDALDPV